MNDKQKAEEEKKIKGYYHRNCRHCGMSFKTRREDFVYCCAKCGELD